MAKSIFQCDECNRIFLDLNSAIYCESHDKSINALKSLTRKLEECSRHSSNYDIYLSEIASVIITLQYKRKTGQY